MRRRARVSCGLRATANRNTAQYTSNARSGCCTTPAGAVNGKRETPNGPHVRLGARSAAQSRSVWHEPGRGREARYDPHFTTRSLVPCEIRDIRSSSPNSRAAHTRRRASAGETIELCYVRFLDTVTALVNTEATVRNPRRPRPRALTQAETLGPFTTYRWHVQPSGCAAGHPAAGGPCYGVVDVSQIRCRVHMLPSLDDPELFRLNTHVWEIS